MISAIKVLNTVTALGTDVSVGSDGIVNIASVETVDAYNVRGASITIPRAEVSGVVTITPTAPTATLATYNFYINAFSMTTGLPKVINVSFISAATPTATSVCNQARAIINADTDLSVVASGTTTIVLTAKTGQPFFVVGGATANIDSYSGAGATTISTGLDAANGTLGKAVRGSVAYLQNKYAYAAAGNALNYNELALLTSGFFYTEVVIDYISTTPSGSGAFKGEISTLQAVVLVRANATGTYADPSNPALSDFTTANYGDLLWTYGTITALAAGYRAILSAPATTTAAVTISTGAIALSGGAATFATLGAQSGDYIVIGNNVTAITGITGAAAGFGTLTDAVSAATFKYAAWRNLPV
jgi:hypothetical protein